MKWRIIVREVLKWWRVKSDIEINKLIENGKKMGIDEIVKQNERVNKNLVIISYIIDIL